MLQNDSALRFAMRAMMHFKIWAAAMRRRQQRAREVVALASGVLRIERLRRRFSWWSSATSSTCLGLYHPPRHQAAQPPSPTSKPFLQPQWACRATHGFHFPTGRAIASAQDANRSGALSHSCRLLSADAQTVEGRDVNVTALQSEVGTFLRVPRNALITPMARPNARPQQQPTVTLEQRHAAATILTKACVHMELAVYLQRFPRVFPQEAVQSL
eukprot:CAMPEP_0173083450 /NCGR_PEP_ID=MMETSP1102-20130122/19442_1 /TAXON_ID=49646 /ORGANISM="Geminigera sp., Strain Caron Lab Isolate" /LENGTH=214 /DNA_ID=CAMNT_0013960357 /DNA_START=74 /DNA_END=718 /DNA_ORIENTATION=+